MKQIYMLVILLCALTQLHAQTVGGYTFSVDSTTAYSPVSGGTVIFGCPAFSSGDESAVVTLPKPFQYEGISYTTIRIGYGGWISFGSNDPLATDASFANNIFSELANVPGAVAVCSKPDYGPYNDGSGCISEVSTTSTANEFTVQWKDINDPEYSTYGIGGINFQLKLEFNTGVIKFCYGGFKSGLGGGQTVKVGLRGNGLDFNTYINNRSADFASDGWIHSQRGNSADAACALQVLPSNLTYIYTPASCFPPADLQATQATGNSVKLIWNTTGSPDGYEYAITNSSTTVPSSGTFVTDPFATVTGLTSTTIYYAWVRSKCGTNYTPWIQTPFRTVCDPVTTLPYTETYPANAALNVKGAHNYFPCIAVENDDLTSGNSNFQWQADINGDGIALNNTGSDSVVSSWFFTKRVQLTGGATYRIYFKYHRAGFNIKQANVLKMQMATYPDTKSLLASPLLNMLVTSSTYDDNEYMDTFALFKPSVTGFYCAGFYSTSNTGLGEMKVYEVEILDNSSVTTSCTKNMEPANNAIIKSGSNFLLKWNKISNAQQYTIYLSDSLYGLNNVAQFSTYQANDTSYTENYNIPDDRISWYVVPRFYGEDATGCATASTTFYIRNDALPLTLLNFSAQLQNKNVWLQWQTTNEINTSQFIIERSANSRDFTGIGTVNAAIENSTANNYSFVDDVSNIVTNSTTLYYRLKMTDKDGKFTYSKIVAVYIKNAIASIKIFPNPAASVLNIKLPLTTTSNIRIIISDAAGRDVLQKTITVKTEAPSLNIENLPRGIYYVTIEQSGQVQKTSFIKI